jgi:hypothetical protein
MLWICWMYLVGWANPPSDDALDLMERNSTELRSITKRLSTHLAAPPTESIPMLQIESTMLEVENMVNTLQTHHSTLP